VADKVVLFIRGLAVEATLPEGIPREALFESDWVVLTDVRVQTGGGAKSMRVRTVSIDAISEPEERSNPVNDLETMKAMSEGIKSGLRRSSRR